MQLFLVSALSLLAAGSCAYAAAVAAYPCRTELFAYSPVRGEFPVVNTLTPGYVRFIDQQGVEQLTGYKYPAPVQSRRDSNDEYLYQLAKESLNKEGAEYTQARNEHLRLWAIDQYVRYRQEMDRLKLAGQEPTADMLAKISTLEILNSAIRNGVDIENPATKSLRDEHIRLWDESRQSAQKAAQQLDKGIDQAAAAKPTIYLRVPGQEQQQIQQDQAKVQGFKIVENLSYIQDTPEVQQAKAEHLRLWHEAKLRAEKAQKESEKYVEQQSKVKVKANYNKQILTKAIQTTRPEQTRPTSEAQQIQQLSTTKSDSLGIYTPANEHLQKKADFIADNQPNTEKAAPPAEPQAAQQSSSEYLATTKSISIDAASSQNQPQQQTAVQETEEVKRAREEHLKLVKEAQLKASQYQTKTAENAAEPKFTLYLATTADKTVDELTDEESHLRAEEAKQRQAELLAEAERLKEEQRLQAEEMLRLQQEEQRRQEQERLDFAAENKDSENYAEKPQLPIMPATKETIDQLIQTQLQTGGDPAVAIDIRDNEKYATNPYLLRYSVQTPNPHQLGKPIATTAYFLGAQQPAPQQQSYGQAGVYYLRDATDGYIKSDNPYFLHYITNQQGSKDMPATAHASALSAFYQGNEAALAALQQATRDNFGAREIALDRLRLANQKQLAPKDCY